MVVEEDANVVEEDADRLGLGRNTQRLAAVETKTKKKVKRLSEKKLFQRRIFSNFQTCVFARK